MNSARSSRREEAHFHFGIDPSFVTPAPASHQSLPGTGKQGVWWFNGSASSVLLKNDFAFASYQGLAYTGTNGPQHRFLFLRNAFNQGYRYHLRPTWEDGRSYFFGENVFKSGTNMVNPFITPYGAPVHFRY